MPTFPSVPESAMSTFVSAASAFLVLSGPGTLPAAGLQEAPRGEPATAEIGLDSALVIRPAMRGGRSPVFTDPVEGLLIRGEWQPPNPGDQLGTGEHAAWQSIEADGNGVFAHRALAGGYAWMTVDSPAERIALLDARGHRHVYINGEPRAGDVYDAGWVRTPFVLREGSNGFLFRGGRGRLRATITEPPAPIFIETRDMTLPDIITGDAAKLLAGIIITNATKEHAEGLAVRTVVQGVESITTLPTIAPLTLRKVPVTIAAPLLESPGRIEVEIELMFARSIIHSTTFMLDVRAPSAMHRRTFVSEIDGSVQYYAIRPMSGPTQPGTEQPALILTLHGAGVEATSQAAAYEAKDWAHIVAPTNRRPFGFDWEDWGRLDALEVLEKASRDLSADPQRTYVTGHSMGGHGTWQMGVHYPHLFAAVAPSAGWPDFWSYTGAPEWNEENNVERMLGRAVNASRSRDLATNLQHSGIYILHGDADDNVPVSQARMMRSMLSEFHTNFAYYERPGAGHWWGNACVDWPPLMEFLRQNSHPADATRKQIGFMTVSPGVSSRFAWSEILQQVRPLEISRLQATIAPTEGAHQIVATTMNIAQIAFDLKSTAVAPAESITLTIDEQQLKAPWPADGVLHLARIENSGEALWQTTEFNPAHKGPHRAGMFKDAFRHRFALVYGTGGTPDQNAWAYARARFDAETFWYRGNGGVDVLPDTAVGTLHPDRNIILYGNASTNLAWSTLLSDSPVDVQPGTIRVGERTFAGDDLACLFIRPRPGSDIASIGVVAGTGPAGMRLTNQLPYFVSGVAYPDWIVIGSDMLEEHAAGIRGLGFFAPDWSLGSDHAFTDSE